MAPRDSESTATPDPRDPLALPSLVLLARLQRGESGARDELLRRYAPRLERWARGRLPERARDLYDTMDLVQETMVAALKGLEDFRPEHESALPAYLRTAILNRIRDQARRVRRQGERVEIDSDLPASAPTPLERAVGAEAVARFERALARLRAEDRDAIHLKVELDLPYEEIAAALGKPTQTAARMAVSRALARLAREMERCADA